MELKGLITKLPLDTIFQVCENTFLNMLKTVRTVNVTNRVIRSLPVFELQFMTKGLKPLLLIFLPLPETSSGNKWIFLVEDTSTKCVELFALKEATSVNCTKPLVEEVFLRSGIPRRLMSDNGPQFICAVMQQTCNFLGIKQDLITVYHPQAKPIRTRLLQFCRELRTTDDVRHDLRTLIDNDNFVGEITPYLKRFARLTAEIKDHVEQKQDKRKTHYGLRRRQAFYKPGDQVWVTLHPISKSQNKKSRKFMPKREGPYLVITNPAPTTYDIADTAKLDEVLGTYHSLALRDYGLPVSRESGTVAPLRRWGRPTKYSADSSPRRRTRHYTFILAKRSRSYRRTRQQESL
ncbi:hypothetical protein AVEN_57406-1 [Araneus ventricosus]|uniref:Integrase catalytic domain-containing protein n=1 Tax=Araneus ventricosus TaxID=182803 RepID=A0A4Y2CWJ0_ARAVE|nr:hypothetical protein AVEN_57406-1 [Araneus ventricosus]